MNTFDYFKQISAIPRETYNEEGIRQYLLKWANENNFKSAVDKVGNVVIYCPATKGYENVPSVLLQGHMDMVCVKTAQSEHNFKTEGIEIYQDGDWLKAKDTSLGGDNGIAIAMTMAIFTDKNVKHGPLEALFTVSEEMGLNGAFGVDSSFINSRNLINLDSEEEGIIYIGCAGGIDVEAKKQVKLEKVPSDWEIVEINISGLLGGHSGGEIHLQRANAINVLARMLASIKNNGHDFMLCSFEGGVRLNVIPGSAKCTICIPSANKKEIMHNCVLKAFEEIKEEYKFQDPGIVEEHHCSKCNVQLTKPEMAVSAEDSENIVSTLYALPHGVYAMSNAVKSVVETSDNLAIAKLDGSVFNLALSVRSLIDSAKNAYALRICSILSAFGFENKMYGSYPSWAPNPNSHLAKLCSKAWNKTFGKEPVVTSIHAGLECGIISSIINGMDSVSIGPNLFDVHTVNEKLSISSTERLYKFLSYLLAAIE